MAAAYTEPSPHLCAHVSLLSGCSDRLFRCRPFHTCVLKSPAALPRRGRVHGRLADASVRMCYRLWPKGQRFT